LHAPGQHPERVPPAVPELSGGNTQAGIFERLEPERDPPLGAVSLLPGAILWRLELEASPKAGGGASPQLRGPALHVARQSPEQRPAAGEDRLVRDQRRDPPFAFVVPAIGHHRRRLAPGAD